MPASLTPETLLADRRWIEDLARRLVRDPNSADDVAQEAWRRALERPPARLLSPRGWLYSLVRSCARELRRGDARRRSRERAASRPEATTGAASLVARADAQRLVLAAVLALDPASREAVLLRYFEELDPSEIARRLDVPPGTVRSRLHRALAVLRTRLDSEYGGDRGAWAVALCGSQWRAGAGTASKGALIVTMKTKAVLGAAALLALLLVWWNAAGAESGRTPSPPRIEEARAPAAHAAPVRRSAAAVETTTTAEAPPAPAPDVAPAPQAPSGPKRLAVRLLDFGEPDAPDPGGRAPGRSGEIADTTRGAVGGGFAIADWRKTKAGPEKGTATLRGRVTDSRGEPLVGADIMRVEPAAGGRDGDVVGFLYLQKIGESAADGSFAFDLQPARAYRLAASWHNTMFRAQGLLLSGAAAVAPHERETVSGIDLRVPVDSRDFGAVTGRVLDDEGSPVQAVVSIGLVTAPCGADGRFRLASVAAGDGEAVVSDYDYRPFRQVVTVRAGAAVDVELRLTHKLSGPDEVDGFVHDGDGRAVGDVAIVCMATDVNRRRRTGPDGSFRFRGLPQLPSGAGWYLRVFGVGVVMKDVRDVAAPAHGFVVEVERSAKLRLLIRDAATSAALPLFNVTMDRRIAANGATRLERVDATPLRDGDGVWTAEVPRGDLVVFVEALDHRAFRGSVDVPRGDDEYEAVIEMQR